MAKLKSFAVLVHDNGDLIAIGDLKNVNPDEVPGTDITGEDELPSGQAKKLEMKLMGFSNNPTWVFINGKWCRIG